tara:strand:+ start:45 stop:1301 length:1257 start_codon:yes stop_codon:yes gene_type:complete
MAKPDPHEVMTAALIARNKKVSVTKLNTKPIEKSTELVNELVNKGWVEKIVGGSGDKGFFVKSGDTTVPNMKNLAKALSVSNYVLDQVGEGNVTTVWQTGKKWDAEIKKYNPDTGTIKNYNSSDLILKIETKGRNEATHYWGLSLKKRGIKDAEPTLLNKPVLGDVGFLTERISGHANKRIKDEKEKFFRGALNIKTGGTYNNKTVDKMSFKEVLDAVEKLFHYERQEKNEMLTGKKGTKYEKNQNTYFLAMHQAFMEFAKPPRNKKFFEDFFDLIFKINMDAWIKDQNFHFSLMTGVGDYKDKLDVEEPNEKEGRLVTEIFREMFKDPDVTNFKLVKQKNKPHAWEDKAKAAKLFYEMVIGTGASAVSIVDLEVRYKGDLRPEPQFQVFINRIRRNSFHHEYHKHAKKKALGKKRWD